MSTNQAKQLQEFDKPMNRVAECTSLPSYRLKQIAEKMAKLKNNDGEKEVLQREAQQILDNVAGAPAQETRKYSADGLLLISKLLKDMRN